MANLFVKLKHGLQALSSSEMKKSSVSIIMDKKSLFINSNDLKVDNIRWYILAVYVYYTTISCFQWVEYSIVTNIVMKYYNVDSVSVDFTGVLFMIVWPVFVFPATFLIDKLGLRFAALAGCFLTAIGSIVKLFSINPNSFGIVLAGQAIVSLSQVFILSLPPKLAVTWFKPNEVSTVCSIGVGGMQLGSALGFLIPPIIVKDSNNLDDISANLNMLCWGITIAILPVCMAIVIYFPNVPDKPPSAIQAAERKNIETVTVKTFFHSINDLIKNTGFLLHTLGYGINFGLYSAFGTLLNQFVLSYFPGATEDAGRMGLIMIVLGMIGGFLVGTILDKTHKYKETTVFVYISSAICLGVLLLCLEMKAMLLVYATIGLFGLFLTAYIPAGMEFASELTYPTNESTTTGLMTAVSQTIGVIFTLLLSQINSHWNTFWAIFIQIGLLLIGSVLTVLVPNNLRRQEAFNKGKPIEFIQVPQEDPIVV